MVRTRRACAIKSEINNILSLRAIACRGILMEASMVRLNDKVYSDKEWRRNQIGIYLASVLFVWGLLLMIVFIR